MSQSRVTIDSDAVGRIMSLEQRTKGLQGRISAIEVRLSGTADKDGCRESGVCEDTEFVPAAQHSSLCPEPGTIEARLSGLELTLNQCIMPENHRLPASRTFDITGLIAGVIMIGASLLLYTGNFDVIKNPLLAMGCGILLIGGALKRIVL